MESHVQVCGWEVTVYVNVASKVAPFHVQTDFLRSTSVAQPQYHKYPCRYNRHAHLPLGAATRRKPATGSMSNIWDWASHAAICLLWVLAFRDFLFAVLHPCSILDLRDDPSPSRRTTRG